MSAASLNPRGRPFQKGNKFGKGNPLRGRIEKLRAALVRACSPEDFDAIAKKLLKQAKAGDVVSAREMFDRALGKPVHAVDITEHRTISPAEGAAELAAIVQRLRERLGPSRN